VVQLERPRAELDARIEARIRQMLADGLVDEVRRLLDSGLKTNPSAARAIGYRETIDFLEGRLREEELAEAIAKDTRGLLRKQLTWFRTQLPPHATRNADGGDVHGLFSA
jgi:tRNA dimethylallyltransferase